MVCLIIRDHTLNCSQISPWRESASWKAQPQLTCVSSQSLSGSHDTDYLKGEGPDFRPQRVAGFGKLEGDAAEGPSTSS